uniref:Uncharacterized protein n=1 Tax=Acrobeloides nanus TaxID=290746 RepID=A0A914CZU2_9BILA
MKFHWSWSHFFALSHERVKTLRSFHPRIAQQYQYAVLSSKDLPHLQQKHSIAKVVIPDEITLQNTYRVKKHTGCTKTT